MRGAGGDAISGAPFGWCVYVCGPLRVRADACARAGVRPGARARANVGRPALGSPYSQPATLWAVGVVRRVIGAEPAAHVTS